MPERHSPRGCERVGGAIELGSVSIAFRSQVDRTDRSTAVQEAFGIRPEAIESSVVTSLSLCVQPGQICLIYGPSGSGKTTLLTLIADGSLPAPARVDGMVVMPDDARIGRFVGLPDVKPLVELLAPEADTAAAIHALNLAGLSDAKLYLRRFSELSNGQRYRAMLAALMASDANVWVADEFLSILDPTTARIVATNVAKQARKLGVTVVVGAPHFDAFLGALKPDVVLRLMSPWEHAVYTGAEFSRLWTTPRSRGTRS
jgi:hypothetical protein